MYCGRLMLDSQPAASMPSRALGARHRQETWSGAAEGKRLIVADAR
jgi:hypothetical protein